MKINYDKREWIIIAETENFIVFKSERHIRPLLKKIVLDLCEEMLKHNYIPDFGQLNNYEVIFRKKKKTDND